MKKLHVILPQLANAAFCLNECAKEIDGQYPEIIAAAEELQAHSSLPELEAFTTKFSNAVQTDYTKRAEGFSVWNRKLKSAHRIYYSVQRRCWQIAMDAKNSME